MKIVVIGGTGLIGSKVVAKLTERPRGHSRLAPLGHQHDHRRRAREALDGASVVIDVSNSPKFEYATALSSSGGRPTP